MKKSLVLLVLLIAVSVLALIVPAVPKQIVTEGIVAGDVAWMLGQPLAESARDDAIGLPPRKHGGQT